MEHSAATPGNSFNTLKKTIAEKLEQAAGSLGRQTETGRVLGPYGRQASEWLRHSAEYVRELDLKKADLELRGRIRAHPGQSVLVGLMAGFFVGLWLRRR
jgi:hypothetical protein